MAFMQWSESLMVKIPSIDAQHQRLVDIINELDAAVQSGHGDDGLASIVARLLEYTQYHFDYEEKLLEQHGYPAFDAHKLEHDSLEEKVGFIENMVKSDDFHGDQLLDFLQIWLREHILSIDMNYAPYLLEKGVQ